MTEFILPSILYAHAIANFFLLVRWWWGTDSSAAGTDPELQEDGWHFWVWIWVFGGLFYGYIYAVLAPVSAVLIRLAETVRVKKKGAAGDIVSATYADLVAAVQVRMVH